jgi:hypothetical protein
MQTSVAKKFFAVGVAASTVLLGLAPFAASAAAHAEGTNVSKSDGTVGMIIGGQFRPYTSAGAFLTYGFNSWGSVVAANADDLALPTGSFIAPQDGKIFCATETKGTDVKGECSLITGGQKAAFTSAAVFTGLGFSFSRAQYGDSSFLAKTSNVDNTTAAHRAGVLVNNNGTVQLVGATGLLGIPDIATFNTWGYSFSDVVPANAADKTMSQTGVMAARVAGQLSPTALTSLPGNVISGNVSASLASDNPASGTIVASSSATTLAKFNFSGTGTVTSVIVKRVGISADTVLSNVYLFDGATRLTDAASVGGSSLVTFSNANGLFTVSGSKTISVVADIAGSASSGQTVGVQLTSYAVAGGAPATVAVSGNLMTVSAVSDLATVDFGAVTPTGGSFDPAKDVEVFKSIVSVGTRDVTMSRLSLRQIGSVNTSDISNFRLMVDGTQLAQVQNMTSDGYVNFAFSPVTLKNGSRTVSVLADIIGGSSRTFQFSIRNKADVQFTDTNYGVNLSATYKTGVFPVAESTNDINGGSLVIQKATDSPSADLTTDASDAVLARYTVTAYGEPMKIETINAAATSSVAITALRNGRVLVNGAQYGSTAALIDCTACTAADAYTQYTLNYTVTPGTPVTVELRADMHDTGGQSLATKTVAGYIMKGSANVQKMTSLGYAGYPAAAVAGNTISVVTGSMSLAKSGNYAGQTTPLPQTNYKLGSFNLVGSSAEDITINSIGVNYSVVAGGASSTNLNYSALTSVKVMVAGNMFGTIKSTLGSATSTFSGSYALKQNTTVPVEVYADIGQGSVSNANVDWLKTIMDVSGTTVKSSASVTASAAGQTITYGTGSLTITKDSSSPSAAIVSDLQTKTGAVFKFKAESGSYTIKEVTVNFPAGAPTSVNNVILKDGTTVLGTMPGGIASVTFSGLSVPVDSNTTKLLTVDLELGTIGLGAGTSNEDLTVRLSSVKYTNSSGTLTPDTTSVPTGNAMYSFAAIPTITNVSLPDGTLAAGTKTLAKFTLSSSGTGTIAWNKLIFSVSESLHATINGLQLVDANTGTAVTGTFASSTDFGNAAGGSGQSGTVTFTVTGNGGQEEITDKTYALKATVGGANVAGDFITVSIAAGQTAHQVTATSTGIAQTETFAWSDESASNHATTTSDWFGDFLVKNIPTDAQTLSK